MRKQHPTMKGNAAMHRSNEHRITPQDYCRFQIGDRVRATAFGDGTVTAIRYDDCAVIVTFADIGKVSYDLSGRYWTNGEPDQTHDIRKIETSDDALESFADNVASQFNVFTVAIISAGSFVAGMIVGIAL